MESSKTQNKADILRLLPSIDALLSSETGRDLVGKVGKKTVTKLARIAADLLRIKIIESNFADKEIKYTRGNLLIEAEKRLKEAFENEQSKSLKRVINATGRNYPYKSWTRSFIRKCKTRNDRRIVAVLLTRIRY